VGYFVASRIQLTSVVFEACSFMQAKERDTVEHSSPGMNHWIFPPVYNQTLVSLRFGLSNTKNTFHSHKMSTFEGEK
jgi:hypothetical protein